MPDLDIIDPSTYPGWDDLVLSHPEGTVFHSSSWGKVLRSAYRFTPKYFALVEDRKLAVAFPLMEVDSFLTGKRAVSLPFTDYCDPLFGENLDFSSISETVLEYGIKSRWESVELRCRKRVLDGIPESCSFLGHVLDLAPGEEALFSGLYGNTRNKIKMAKNKGVTFSISSDPAGMKEFYRLNCLTRREHGLPPQPCKFFRLLQEEIIGRNRGLYAFALCNGRPVAGGLFLFFGDRVYYKYGASDRAYQNLRGTNLMVWEAIKWFSRRDFRTFCFGRTEMNNEGLIKFKRGWGGAASAISYYKYNFKTKRYVKDNLMIEGSHNKIFRMMPMPLLRAIGSALYRHVA